MTEEQTTILSLLTAQAEVVDAFCEFYNSPSKEKEKYSDILLERLKAQHKVFAANQKATLEMVNRWEAGE